MKLRTAFIRLIGLRAFACQGRALLTGFMLCLLAGPLLAQTSERLEVTGAVQKSLSLSADDLKAFPPEHIAEFVRSRGAPGAESKTTVRGVKLAALIERAGLDNNAKTNWKTLLVIATATDGYRAIYAWPELNNNPSGDGVLVIFEQDGNPLDAREGRIAMLSTLDKRLGARHVRNLWKIEVRPVP